jgi:hypothetical protein
VDGCENESAPLMLLVGIASELDMISATLVDAFSNHSS